MTKNEKEISILEHMKKLVTVRTFEEEALEKAIQALEEIQAYQAIGTIDEFKALKNTDIPIIHGKAELELHDKGIRNKAIDEFAERLKDDILGHFRLWGIIEEPTDYCDCIDEVAEKLKGRKKQ